MPEEPTPEQPEAPAQPTYPQIGAQITPDGLVIQVVPAPVTLTIGNEELKAIARGLIANDAAFATELVKQVVERARAVQEKIAVVRDPKTVKRISSKKNT